MNALELITRLSSHVNFGTRGLIGWPSGGETNPETERYQNSPEARRAPSTMAASWAHTIVLMI